ncbi:NAD(P)-dependent oxidoreductase [Paenibacillus sp. TH7-28]
MKQSGQPQNQPTTGAAGSVQSPAPVTVLGLGPMGQALAGAFLKNGHPTTVWNRSPEKARQLVEQGAVLAGTAGEAVLASPLTIICVLDYNAVESILGPLGDELGGRTIVNLTADTPEKARSMAAWASRHRIAYLDGAIMTPTPTIGTPSAVFLYSGPEAVYQAASPSLASLGGTASFLGEDPGRAAAYDVALLDLFWTSMSGYTHALALATSENIAAKDFAKFALGIAAILPGLIEEWADHVEAEHYPGHASNIISAAAGMEHIIDASRNRGIDASVLSAARATAQRAIDKGHGADSFSRLTQVFKHPSV